jgi:ankyrin repeat protein
MADGLATNLEIAMKTLRPVNRCASASTYLLLAFACGCTESQTPLSAPAPTNETAAQNSPDEAQPAAPAAKTGKKSRIRLGEFHEAAREGNIDKVRAALEEGMEVDATDPAERTALMFAAFDGHTDLVKFLLKKMLLKPGANVDQRDGLGRTALIYAATGPNAETVKTLLDAGANVNVVETSEGFTPLMFAAAEGHLEVVKLLLSSGAKPDIRDKDNDTAANFAAMNGHQEIVQLLMGK